MSNDERPNSNCTHCEHTSHAGPCDVELSPEVLCACDQGDNSTYNCDRCGVDFPTIKAYYDHPCPFDP